MDRRDMKGNGIAHGLRLLGKWEADEGSPYAWREGPRWETHGTPDDDNGGAAVIAMGVIGIVGMVAGSLLTIAAQAIW